VVPLGWHRGFHALVRLLPVGFTLFVHLSDLNRNRPFRMDAGTLRSNTRVQILTVPLRPRAIDAYFDSVHVGHGEGLARVDLDVDVELGV
jgi:hypothetical protein